jgi:putative peptide zinc metalloprotease protein
MLANDNPPRPALRNDLNWVHQPETHKWIVNEPFSNLYYYLSDKERDVANLLDGTKTLDEITSIIQRRWFAGSECRFWLEQLLRRFSHWNLMRAEKIRPAEAYKATNSKWSAYTSLLKNPLAIRIPLLRLRARPRLLQYLAYCVFHPILATLGCIAFVLICFGVIQGMLHEPERLFYDVRQLRGDRWFGLLAALILVKSMHEFGHYLACLRWNVACQEMGMLLLCFSPCFYCDTTDAWKLPSRWQRAAIGAAGIYIELWISVFAGLVYLNTNSSFPHTLAASVWLMCTLGTLLLNGNPCFRYDGYYILSDLIHTPNLSHQSSKALWAVFIKLLGGRKPESGTFDQPVGYLATFAAFASLYRLFITFFILVFLWRFLTPSGFGLFFIAIASTMALGMLMQCKRFVLSLAAEFFTKEPIKPKRVGVLGLIAAAIVISFLVLPIPRYAKLRGFIEHLDSIPIYAPETGLLSSLPTQSTLQPGDRILQIKNSQLEFDLLDMQQQIELLKLRESILEKSRTQEGQVDYELPTLREILRELEIKRDLLIKELEQLTLTCERQSSIVYAESFVLLPEGGYCDKPLSQQSATRDYLLLERNRDCLVERGSYLGRIAFTNQWSVRAFMSQADLNDLPSPPTPGFVINDAFPHRYVPGFLGRVATDPTEDFPDELKNDSQLLGLATPGGEGKFQTPHYQVDFQLDHSPTTWTRGDLVSIYLRLPSKTPAQLFWKILESATKP